MIAKVERAKIDPKFRNYIDEQKFAKEVLFANKVIEKDEIVEKVCDPRRLKSDAGKTLEERAIRVNKSNNVHKVTAADISRKFAKKGITKKKVVLSKFSEKWTMARKEQLFVRAQQ